MVEDEFIVLRVICEQLARLGYDVVGTARDGANGIAEALRLKPDIVVMDIGLPDMDGIEASRKIMTHSPLPVVVLSAYDDRQRLEEAKAAGAIGYVVKPIAEQQLKETIEQALSGQGQ